MIQKIKFHKKKSGKWLIDPPELEGEDLEMTGGFSSLLSLISGSEDVIYLQMGDEKFPGSSPLIFLEIGSIKEGGGWYLLPSYGESDLNTRVFLSDLFKSIFGGFPETIWFYKSF